MRVAMIRQGTSELLAVGDDRGFVPVEDLGMAAVTLGQLAGNLELARERLCDVEVSATAGISLGPPVAGAQKVVCVGLNYRDHIAETGLPAPSSPLLFAKMPTAISGPHDDIDWDPEFTSQLDYEVELAVVVGRRLWRVGPAEAAEAILGYCVANDVSSRDVQFADQQWMRSKSPDTYCPVGPWVTTADEVDDPAALRLWCEVNGDRRQDSTTAELLFDPPTVLSVLSQTTTLLPGDLLLTGTPPGVAMGMEHPKWLNDGDLVRCGIDGLGEIENRVVRRAQQP